jgi:hypothetical protein
MKTKAKAKDINSELPTEVIDDEVTEVIADKVADGDEDLGGSDEPIVRVPSPREEMMKEILESRGKDRPIADDDGESGTFDINQEKVDTHEKINNTSIVSQGGESFLKLKVDGVEKQIPIDEAIKILQKSDSADAKLKQAALILKQAEEKRQSQTFTPPDNVKGTAVESRESLKNALTKLYDGDIDEATEALSSLFSGRSGSVSNEELSNLFDSKMHQRDDDKNLQTAYKGFQKNENFNHILQDPTLTSKLDIITAELQQDPEFLATSPSYEDYFTEAGNRVNEWLGTLTNQPNKQKPTENQDSVNSLKKRKGEGLQSMTVRRGAPTPEKPRTRGDILGEMASRRGQRI